MWQKIALATLSTSSIEWSPSMCYWVTFLWRCLHECNLFGWRMRCLSKSWTFLNFRRKQHTAAERNKPQFRSATDDITPFKVNWDPSTLTDPTTPSEPGVTADISIMGKCCVDREVKMQCYRYSYSISTKIVTVIYVELNVCPVTIQDDYDNIILNLCHCVFTNCERNMLYNYYHDVFVVWY